MKVALALGSNHGNRKQYLFKAIKELNDKKYLSEILCSTIYETPALLLPGSPAEWDKDFLNCIIVGNTTYAVSELLALIKDIEISLGRSNEKKWSPREIDIDILLYENLYVSTPDIQVPHKSMLERNFVLLPLKEVASEWQYPGPGRYNNLTISSIVREKYDI